MDQKVKIVAVLASMAAIILLIIVTVERSKLNTAEGDLKATKIEVEELKTKNDALTQEANTQKNECLTLQGELSNQKKRFENLAKQLVIKQQELDKRTAVRAPTTSKSTTKAPTTVKTR